MPESEPACSEVCVSKHLRCVTPLKYMLRVFVTAALPSLAYLMQRLCLLVGHAVIHTTACFPQGPGSCG